MFLFASVVYGLTMESTASLWDCGEFIASAQKQQVVHPPGAPMFLMIARMFTLLAGGNELLVGLSQNFMSALCSGLAMMFLFWITTHIARRLLGYEARKDITNRADVFAIIGAGAIAAMCGTFTDSIWFSAVEGEVYSMSLLFTAIVVWAITKWEERADEPLADRWILFIAFVVGCSIFVHWLNLLTIPALTFVYYFKRYKPSRKGIFLTLFISIAILGFILNGVITGIISLAAATEIFFVNNLGLPFSSGAIFFFGSFIGALVFSLWYTHKTNRPTLHNALLAFVFVLIGYSTISTTVIRSNADPNIDMNNPEDLVSLDMYLKREQYGSRPFLTGYYYDAKVVDYIEKGAKYQRGEDKYDKVGDRIDYKYEGRKTIFPRIYDTSHKANYERWLGLRKGEKPSFADNIRFFFKYQIGHMYVRYFMWNYAGRQNDEQGLGGIKDGNWISGIPFIDRFQVGPQANLPSQMGNHAARNTYFFLPLLLGLLGMVFHFTNKPRWAAVVFTLFLFLGIAIIVQGNSPPIEPRERDYIFAGSFYAFTIWLGLGVIALYDLLKSKVAGQSAAIGAIAIALLAPAIMGFQGWHDHDRSGRFAARDFAANYLNSCAPNSIIFTQGDNDTYPLWYAQEVEGIRRDVRVVNLSLLGVDWYINQLRRKVNDAGPVPMTLSSTQIRGTKRDVVPFVENPKYKDESIELMKIMEFIGDDSPNSKAPGMRRDTDYYPTRNFKMTVDKEAVLKSGAIAPGEEGLMVDELKWRLNKSSLYKNDLMVLDIIAANNWKKPIYFAISVSPSSYLGLEKYFQLEGLAYRLVPIEVKDSGPFSGRPNIQLMYDNLMNKFKFGNIDSEDVHVDNDLRRMVLNFRGNYARLAEALIAKGYPEKAVEVLDRSIEVMPDHAAPFNMYMLSTIQNYYDAGAPEKGNELAEQVADRLIENLKYFEELPSTYRKAWEQDEEMASNLIQIFIRSAAESGQPEFAKKLEDKLRGK